MRHRKSTHNQTRWARRCVQRNKAEARRVRGGGAAPEPEPDAAVAAIAMAVAGKIRRGSTRKGES